MGCGGSKQSIKETEGPNRPQAKGGAMRTRVENYQVENGALYSGEMLNGQKDGEGTQKCMCAYLCFRSIS